MERPTAGPGTRIDDTALFFGAGHVEIGAHVRIDAYCVITAGPGIVRIGDHVHLGAATHVFGTAGVDVGAYGNVSSRVSIFSTNDDYTEGHVGNPTTPEEVRGVTAAPVTIERHAIVGCGSVILPGVRLGIGASVGALSLVKHDVPPFAVVAGTPARRIGDRDRARVEAFDRRLRDP